MIKRLTEWRTLAVSLAFAFAAAYLFFVGTATGQDQYTIEVELAANTATTARLFCDFGKGFKEEHSVRKPVVAAQKLTPVRFPIGCGDLVRLRLDPMDVPGTGSIGEIRILDEHGARITEIAPSVEIERNLKFIRNPSTPAVIDFIATTRDPQLFATFPAVVPLPDHHELVKRTVSALPVFIVVFAGVLLISTCTKVKEGNEVNATEPSISTLNWFLIGSLLFAAIKLWLVSGQTLYALVDAQHDDALFVSLANHVLGARWLGPYSEFTLMKGPMYSLFIAGVFVMGVPLLFAQHLLYTAGCWLIIRALRPLNISAWILLPVFLLLLFNPVTYDAGAHTRVLRQNLSVSLVLIVASSGIALYTRLQLAPGKLLPWALAGGAALAAFWLTREDSIWLLPLIVLLWGALFVALWRDRRLPDWLSRVVLAFLPFLVWAAGVGAVAWLNYQHYGVFTSCEMKHPAFKAAYGALLRIEPPDRKRYVSVTAQTRELAYAVSPAFAQLRRFIERTHDGPPAPEGTKATREIEDAYFVWTLRTAVFESGNANNGREAMAFYEQMADEINTACDKGLIPAGSPRSGFFPPWKFIYMRQLVATLRHAAVFFVSFSDLSVGPQPSLGSPEGFVRFEDITRNRITPPSGYPPIPREQRWLDSFRRAVLKTIQDGYHYVGTSIAVTSLLAFFASFALSIARRRFPFSVLLGAGLVLSCTAIVTICSLIETLSFRAVFTMYFTAAYGLWLLFIATSWLGLAEVWRERNPRFVPSPR
ncbi:MAG: hypothetical protein QM790_03160 [Nibricoccus sp.]